MRVRAAVSGGRAARIAASFGLPAAPRTARCGVSDLPARAGSALHRPKRAGKNRIVCG